MYGERDDPYAVLSRLGQRLEAALAPDAALNTVVQTVAQALKLPYAEISLKQGDGFVTAASYGEPADERVALPLTYGAELVRCSWLLAHRERSFPLRIGGFWRTLRAKPG